MVKDIQIVTVQIRVLRRDIVEPLHRVIQERHYGVVIFVCRDTDFSARFRGVKVPDGEEKAQKHKYDQKSDIERRQQFSVFSGCHEVTAFQSSFIHFIVLFIMFTRAVTPVTRNQLFPPSSMKRQ